MSYSKFQFIQAAFSEIGLADYIFDLQPSDLESALRRLDSMMADWNSRGLRLSYPIPGSPEYSDIQSVTQVPDSANEAIITNLAIKIAPSYGKSVSVDTRNGAYSSLIQLMAHAAQPIEQQFDACIPIGAGYKTTQSSPVIISPAEQQVQVGNDGNLDLF